jgi:mercuric ion binding protein
MKTINLIILLLSLSIKAATAQTAVKDSIVNSDGTVTIQLKTSSVCEMCKETIEKALAYEKGIKSSDLVVDSKVLTVVYDPRKTNSIKVKVAVSKSGYDADEWPADSKAYERLHSCCKKDSAH